MSKVYAQAPSGVAERVTHLVKVFHKDIHDAGVTFDLISVADDDPEVEHPLKLHGYPCAAVIRAVDVKGRTMGRGDAEIVIDESAYLMLTDAEKDALLDHEIEHVELQVGKKGRVKLDCCGRPKIKMRLHDVNFGWFESIAQRHGNASLECKQATKIYLNHTQTFFAFVGHSARPELPSGDSVMDRVMNDVAFGRNIGGLTKVARDHGATIEIRSGGKSVTIGKEGVRGEHPDPDSTNE